MGHEFVSLIDGKTFESEAEALNHFLSNHCEERENDFGIDEIKEMVRAEFPDFIVEVSKFPHTPDHERYVLNEHDPWFNENEIIFVTLTHPYINCPNLNFSIKKPYPNYPNELEYDEFETLDAALLFYKKFIQGAEMFRSKVFQEIQKLDPSVRDCVVSRIEQTYGTADTFYEWQLEYIYIDGRKENSGWIQLTHQDILSDEVMENEVHRFVNTLKSNYQTEFEGVVTLRHAKYCNDHRSWYEVNGVSLLTILNRAKRLRVEIIEKDNKERK